jgi:hypothetical protein
VYRVEPQIRYGVPTLTSEPLRHPGIGSMRHAVTDHGQHEAR